MEFKDVLKMEREKRGLKQADLARELDISPHAYKLYEKGTYPSLSVAVRIADFFEVSLDYLFLDCEKLDNQLKDINDRDKYKEYKTLKAIFWGADEDTFQYAYTFMKFLKSGYSKMDN